ncbi:MAG: SDR family oxidoreductase [Tunicatimonas sp.]|uniref:SDR family NAD(P)-dependent oxidoreductase n=1 Tax=Tunicatimonas sp. TaxID=1940096 RepID=UPI003C7465BD
MKFKGKNILLIGGTSGIGKATLDILLEEGASITVASRQAPSDHENITHIPLDVLEMTDELDALPEQLHGLVYTPGTITLKPFQSLKPADFQREIELNAIGAVKVIQAALKNLRAAKGASVVMFSTVAVQLGLNFHTAVAMAKGAVEGLGRALAAELANKNVRVNVVAPSLTDTPLADNLLSTDEKKEASNKRHPLGRYGKPDDIAQAVVYLLSDNSSWVTGQVFHIDGGLSSVKHL